MTLKFKLLLLCIFLTSNLFSAKILSAKIKIQYKELISTSSLKYITLDKLPNRCNPLLLEHLDQNKYIAKHYIKKGSILCLEDVKVYKKESVLFNFGNIQIEKDGKVIFENDKYITIKKRNGKIEKIYKNGINK